MKTLIAALTFGGITLFAPAEAAARDCNDGHSRYRSSRSSYGSVRVYSYAPVQYYYRSYSSGHGRSCYVDPHHRYARVRYDRYGHRIDSHGHHVDRHGHHRR